MEFTVWSSPRCCTARAAWCDLFGLRFSVLISGIRVEGLGLRVEDAWFGVEGIALRVEDLMFRVEVEVFGFRVEG